MFKRRFCATLIAALALAASIVFPAFGQSASDTRALTDTPVASSTPSAAETASDAMGDYFRIEAGGLDYSESDEVYRVGGGVKISFASYTVETDAINIDRRDRSATSEGAFRMQAGQYVFEGESFRYFYEDERGRLEKVKSGIEGANYRAETVEFNSSNGIIMKNVTATTCCEDNMQYHVEAGSVELLDGDRAKFRDISLYFRGRKIFKWPSYTMKLDRYRQGEAPAAPVGGWSYSSPSIGYSNYGGVEIETNVRHVSLKRKLTTGLFLDFYALDGLFTEARAIRDTGSGYSYALRYGKQYKKNTGYFRYFSPVIVWNEPVVEIVKEEARFPGTKIYYTGRFEAGRLREKRMPKALDRAFVNVQGRYPLSGPGRRMRFSLLTDGRFAAYRKYQDFKLGGGGAEVEMGAADAKLLRLQYMRFRHSGRTPFKSDLVNTNSKFFGFGAVKIDRRNSLMADAQYDLERKKFEEIEYSLIRDFQCVKFYFSYRTEQQSVGMSLQILGAGGKNK